MIYRQRHLLELLPTPRPPPRGHGLFYHLFIIPPLLLLVRRKYYHFDSSFPTTMMGVSSVRFPGPKHSPPPSGAARGGEEAPIPTCSRFAKLTVLDFESRPARAYQSNPWYKYSIDYLSLIPSPLEKKNGLVTMGPAPPPYTRVYVSVCIEVLHIPVPSHARVGQSRHGIFQEAEIAVAHQRGPLARLTLFLYGRGCMRRMDLGDVLHHKRLAYQVHTCRDRGTLLTKGLLYKCRLATASSSLPSQALPLNTRPTSLRGDIPK